MCSCGGQWNFMNNQKRMHKYASAFSAPSEADSVFHKFRGEILFTPAKMLSSLDFRLQSAYN